MALPAATAERDSESEEARGLGRARGEGCDVRAQDAGSPPPPPDLLEMAESGFCVHAEMCRN